MHRSRLSSIVIDCKTTDLDAATEFWSRALGRPWKRQPDNDPNYRELAGSEEEPMLLVQRVDHDSRVHLDIETDDLDAELARLEALGAHRVAFVRNWWVMQAPTGQRFCVVKLQRGPLAGKKANQWP